MAFTTAYSFEFVQDIGLVFTGDGIDLAGLSGGGLVGVGDTSASQSNATFFDDDLDLDGFSALIGGVDGSVDQLTNGNVVIALETSAGDMVYQITTATGAIVLADTEVGEAGTSAADVAALAGGGFVIATTDFIAAGNHNIEARVYDAAGAPVTAISVDATAADDNRGVVTGLADGGFAVAWTRTAAGPSTEAWYAVFEANGTVRKSATLLDTAGTTNANMSIVALSNGGFGVAYQDTGWNGNLEITYARIDAAGNNLGFTQATNWSGDDTRAALTTLSNGLIALTYSSLVSGDTDIYVQLLDPVTGALLMTNPAVVVASAAQETDSSAAGWGLAGLAVSFSGGAVNAKATQLVRTATGDGVGDLIAGDDAVDLLNGNGGADTLTGAANDDRLDGGAGADSLSGGQGDDRLDAGAGLDSDTLDGGAGLEDVADYHSAGAAVSIDLGFVGAQNTGGAGTDVIAGIEHLLGTAGSDDLKGNGFGNFLSGDAGADTLTGSGGNDSLLGGAGIDHISGGVHDDLAYAGVGADVMAGGSGNDTLDYSYDGLSLVETFIDLADTSAQNTHSSGADAVIGWENVLTALGDDRILGNGSANRFESLGGADTLKSKDGADILLAGDGDDVINAGGGGDLITGGEGRDSMRGGLGADVFIYAALAESGLGLAAADVIRDFRTSDGDKIDLSGVFDGTLVYIGAAPFTGFGVQAEVAVLDTAQGQLVRVDANKDGDSDMELLVVNSGLTGGTADFVL